MEVYLSSDGLRAALVLLDDPLARRIGWLVSAPCQLFAGWVSAAVFVNTVSTLQRSGTAIGRELSAAMLLLAGVLGVPVAVLTGGWIYGTTVAWALFGIIIANTAHDNNNRPIAILACLLAFVGWPRLRWPGRSRS